MFQKFQAYLKQNAGFSEEEFQQLTAVLKTKNVEKGAFLLQPGEVCQHIFFVEKGLLRSFSIGETGKEHIIQFAPENWFLGDHGSTYFDRPSDFFIEAIEETQMVLLKTDFVCQASEISTAFGQYNEKLLHKHILYMQRRLNLLLGATAEKRYLDFIQLYPDILLRVPQWMIASYLGITPESLSRVRKELTRRNFKPL